MKTGTEIFNSLAHVSREARERFAIMCAIDGSYVRWPMIEVPVGPDSHIYVTSDYFSLGSENDFIRMPLGGRSAQQVADALGMLMLTTVMVDRVWAAAKQGGIVIEPQPLGPPYDASMESMARLGDHERRINTALTTQSASWRGRLIAGHKKDVVISPRRRAGWLAFYGWHHLDGQPIQGLNLSAHAQDYADYSHGLRLAAPMMVLEGREVPLADVLADPNLCSRLSKEGRVTSLARYPSLQESGEEMNIPPTIKRGSRGQDVARWQKIVGASPDGDFGPRTEALTKDWQTAHRLTADGVVGPKTWAVYLEKAALPTDPQLPAKSDIAFVQAKHYAKGGMGTPKLIVIHTMEWGETVNTSESCAQFFTNPQTKNKAGELVPVTASAHYCVDVNSIVQCVKETDAAWHTPGFVKGKEINRIALGVEHAGYAKQTPAEWADPYSMSMLRLSAQLVGDLCKRYEIPPRRLTKEQLLAGEAGIVGHVDCTNAVGGSHWDPGPNFPWNDYLKMVAEYAQ